MTSTLPAAHLLRQFLLFALFVLSLQLALRAGYALWRYPAFEEAGLPLAGLFLTGLRFDLSLVGGVCLVPLALGSLLGAFDATRGLARVLVVVWLVLALGAILAAELLTPVFIAVDGARPDAAVLADPAELAVAAGELVRRYPAWSAAGSAVLVLVLVAYAARMEPARLLRHRLARRPALALAVLGGLACAALARSRLDPREPPLALADVALGGPPVVDQIAANSGWTLLAPLLSLGP